MPGRPLRISLGVRVEGSGIRRDEVITYRSAMVFPGGRSVTLLSRRFTDGTASVGV